VRSNNREYLPAVDHLRFLAAGLVILFHCLLYVGATIDHQAWTYSHNPVVTFFAEGHTGVALFMVLSGFILTTGSLGRDIDYKSFVRNRLLRVGPLYLLVLIAALAFSGSRFSLTGAVQTTLGFATFNGGFTGGALDKVLWTIGVELQFYFLFPFFLRLLNNRGPKQLLQFIGLMAAVRIVASLATHGLDYNHITYYSIVGRIDQFLIGMLAAYYFPRLRPYLGRIWVVALAVAAVGSALWAFNQVHGWAEPRIWRTVWVDAEALLWATVLVSYVGTARFARGRLSKALSWGGERSYGMYLLHMVVIQMLLTRGWLLHVTGGRVIDAMLTGLLVVLPGVLLLATLSFSAVERPFLSLRRRYVNLAAVGAEPAQPARLPAHPVPAHPLPTHSRGEAPHHTVELARMPAQRAGA
jgi:peptidoglycan/LPS O-acetylase OafA/YrhL